MSHRVSCFHCHSYSLLFLESPFLRLEWHSGGLTFTHTSQWSRFLEWAAQTSFLPQCQDKEHNEAPCEVFLWILPLTAKCIVILCHRVPIFTIGQLTNLSPKVHWQLVHLKQRFICKLQEFCFYHLVCCLYSF